MRAGAELLGLLRAPVVTEKAGGRGPRPQYAFRVARSATKPLVKRAVELAFNVKVATVRIVSMPPKQRRFRGVPGRRSGWKKAYVQLAPGSTIDLGG